MKFKKEYLILIVIIVALVLYLTTRSANHDSEIPQLAKLEAAKINRLVLTAKEGTPIELVKKDAHWVIEPKQYTADGTKVKNMVNAVADLTLTALVSEASSYDRYGLTPKEKVLVQAYSEGKIVRALDVGKVAPTQQHTFVLIEGDPKVYHARSQMDGTFNQTIESLRDKAVFDVERQSVNEITLTKGGQSLTLLKKEIPKEEKAETQTDSKEEEKATPEPAQFQWQKPDGQVVAESTADGLAGGISKLSCDSYLADEDKAKLTNPVWTVTFKNGEGEYSLSIFAKEDEKADKFPATASTSPYPFYLPKWRVDKVEKTFNELMGIKEEKETPEMPKAEAPKATKTAAKKKVKKTK